MVEVLGFLKNGFFSAAISLAFFALVLLVLLAWFRERQATRPPRRDPNADFTNMTILFQTMRDLLEQQKDLARKLQKNLDAKLALIRKELSESRAELEEMRRTALHMRRAMSAMKSEDAGAPWYVAPPSGEVPAEAEASSNTVAFPGRTEGRKTADHPSLHVLPKPAAASPDAEAEEEWVGLDFGGIEPDPLSLDVPDEPPEEPGDPEAARAAFRALLDMEGAARTAPGATAQPSVSPRQPARGNGRTPLQRRVYEYCDAGMTVPQISKELGIGKGEVRLILSLRAGKGQ